MKAISKSRRTGSDAVMHDRLEDTFALLDVIFAGAPVGIAYVDRDLRYRRINERMAEAQLPEGIERPMMGPVATGLGEVYHYLLTSENPEYDLTELRSLQDWAAR